MREMRLPLLRILAIVAILSTVLVVAAAILIYSSQPMKVPPLTEVRAIHIEDDWGGFNTVAPLKAHYDLEPVAGQFGGKVDFSGGGSEYPHPAVTATSAISISGNVVQSFLKALEQSPVEEGVYNPPSGITDDYPWLKIQIQLATEAVVFSSTSPGEGTALYQRSGVGPWSCCDHKPWALTLGGKTYVINTTDPDRALGILAPYLKEDVFTKLIDQAAALP